MSYLEVSNEVVCVYWMDSEIEEKEEEEEKEKLEKLEQLIKTLRYVMLISVGGQCYICMQTTTGSE